MVQEEEEMTQKLETLPGLQFCPFEGASTGSALWRGDNSGFFSLPLLSPLSTPLPLSLMMLNQILSLLMNHTFEYLSDSGVRHRHNLSVSLRLGSWKHEHKICILLSVMSICTKYTLLRFGEDHNCLLVF